MQTDHSIPAKVLDLVLINKKKKTCHVFDFECSKRPQSENKRKRNILEPC